jgi:hypothetical protein
VAIVATMSSQIACSGAPLTSPRARPALSLVPPPPAVRRRARGWPAPCRMVAAGSLGAATGLVLAGLAELPLGGGAGLLRGAGFLLAVAGVALARSRVLVRRAGRRTRAAAARR